MGLEDLIDRMCTQTAVYWGSPTNDGYGTKTFSDPIEISCRWEDKTDVVTDNEGKEIVSRALVYVTQDIDEEGYLYLGDLDDLDSEQEADPQGVDGAFEIKRFDKSPEIRQTNKFIRKAYL